MLSISTIYMHTPHRILDNRSVTRLNLSNNSLGGESINALATILSGKNCPLTVLDLAGNDLEEEHVAAIYQALQDGSNKQLISVDLRMNKFSPG